VDNFFKWPKLIQTLLKTLQKHVFFFLYVSKLTFFKKSIFRKPTDRQTDRQTDDFLVKKKNVTKTLNLIQNVVGLHDGVDVGLGVGIGVGFDVGEEVAPGKPRGIGAGVGPGVGVWVGPGVGPGVGGVNEVGLGGDVGDDVGDDVGTVGTHRSVSSLRILYSPLISIALISSAILELSFSVITSPSLATALAIFDRSNTLICSIPIFLGDSLSMTFG